MSTPNPPRSSRDDVLQFLDSLDNIQPQQTNTSSRPSLEETPANPANTSLPTVTNAAEAQSVLDFLDEITQRSSAPPKLSPSPSKKPASVNASPTPSRINLSSTPLGSSRKSLEQAPSPLPPKEAATKEPSSDDSQQAAASSWGWSSVWNQASNVVQQASVAVQQARTIAEENAAAAGLSNLNIKDSVGALGDGLFKVLNENEQTKKWSEGVVNYAKNAHLDQIGTNLKSTTLKSLTELLNAVAPPITEHETLFVSLSHDMVGYDGVEGLVYAGLSKILEQIDGGTLVIKHINSDKASHREERDLSTIEGLAEGWKLASDTLDELIKTTFKRKEVEPVEDGVTVPVTECPIYIRIQSVTAPLPSLPNKDGKEQLFFLFVLRDPTHNIEHHSLSQGLPKAWLDIPFEENEWVEDFMVDALRKAVEILGKEYIETRMNAQTEAISKAREAAQQVLATPTISTPQPEAQAESSTAAASRAE